MITAGRFSSDCRLPWDGKFRFLPTRQPVVIDFWKDATVGKGDTFTTIGNWRQQWRQVVYKGETFIDDDGFESTMVPIRATVTIQGDTMSVDLTIPARLSESRFHIRSRSSRGPNVFNANHAACSVPLEHPNVELST